MSLKKQQCYSIKFFVHKLHKRNTVGKQLWLLTMVSVCSLPSAHDYKSRHYYMVYTLDAVHDGKKNFFQKFSGQISLHMNG